MQQRYYDPRVGRFWSVDPVTVDSVGGNFNRYWYANNNPYRFTDPDGRQAKEGYEFDTCGITGCNSGSFNESRMQSNTTPQDAEGYQQNRAIPDEISEIEDRA